VSLPSCRRSQPSGESALMLNAVFRFASTRSCKTQGQCNVRYDEPDALAWRLRPHCVSACTELAGLRASGNPLLTDRSEDLSVASHGLSRYLRCHRSLGFAGPLIDKADVNPGFLATSPSSYTQVFCRQCRTRPRSSRLTSVTRCSFCNRSDGAKKGSGKQHAATTMAFVRLLRDRMRDMGIGDRILPIIPDEARTFGTDSFPYGQDLQPARAALYLSRPVAFPCFRGIRARPTAARRH
jgi:Pyruvate dehydrogenase E1 component middle domain